MASSPTSNHNVPAHPASASGRPVVRGLLAVVLVLGAVSSFAHDRPWPHRHIGSDGYGTGCGFSFTSGCAPIDQPDPDPPARPVPEDRTYSAQNRELARPRLKGVTIHSTPVRDATYGVGEWIRVLVRFDRPVTVSGNPTLKIDIGRVRTGHVSGGGWSTPTERIVRRSATHETLVSLAARQPSSPIVPHVRGLAAAWTREDENGVNPYGDENYIVFSYQVQADDLDVDGISIANNALTGGSITGPYVYVEEDPNRPILGGGSLVGTIAGAQVEPPPPPPEPVVVRAPPPPLPPGDNSDESAEEGGEEQEAEEGAAGEGEEEEEAQEAGDEGEGAGADGANDAGSPPAESPPAPTVRQVSPAEPSTAEQSEGGDDGRRASAHYLTRTIMVPAYTELGAQAFQNDTSHKVDGRKRRVPTFGSATAGPYRFDSGVTVSQTLPAASGGDGAVAYTVERSGTPNAAVMLPCGLGLGNGPVLATAGAQVRTPAAAPVSCPRPPASSTPPPARRP